MKTMIALMLMAGAGLAQDGGRADALRRLETIKVTVDFRDVTLPDAVDYLREVTGLNLVVLPSAQRKAGDARIRFAVRELAVKSALKLMLQGHDLAATWRDGAVAIVPREELSDAVSMELLDVRALLVKVQDFPGPVVELVKPDGTPQMGANVFMLEEPRQPISEELLVDLVRENTGGRSWDENPKAALSLVNGTLVVNQTPAVLREVRAFLRRLGGLQ